MRISLYTYREVNPNKLEPERVVREVNPNKLEPERVIVVND